jgi:hypothetical protein
MTAALPCHYQQTSHCVLCVDAIAQIALPSQLQLPMPTAGAVLPLPAMAVALAPVLLAHLAVQWRRASMAPGQSAVTALHHLQVRGSPELRRPAALCTEFISIARPQTS